MWSIHKHYRLSFLLNLSMSTMNLTSSVMVLQRKSLANIDTDGENSDLAPSRRYVWYCKLRTCSKNYTAWSCKSHFPSTYMKHQCTAMILKQRRVKGDANFQGVGGRRRLTISASPRKGCRKSMTIMRETKASDVPGKAEPFEKSIHRKISCTSKRRPYQA